MIGGVPFLSCFFAWKIWAFVIELGKYMGYLSHVFISGDQNAVFFIYFLSLSGVVWGLLGQNYVFASKILT